MEAREGNNMGFVDYIAPKPYWVLIAIVSIAGKVGHFRSYGDHDRALISGGRLLPEEYVIKVGIPAPLLSTYAQMSFSCYHTGKKLSPGTAPSLLNFLASRFQIFNLESN